MKLKNTNNEKPKRPPTETKDQHLQSPPPLFELSGLRPPLPPQTVGPSSPTYTSSAEEDRRGTAPPSTAAAAAAPCHSLFSPTDEGRRHAPCGAVVPHALFLALLPLLEDGCRHAQNGPSLPRDLAVHEQSRGPPPNPEGQSSPVELLLAVRVPKRRPPLCPTRAVVADRAPPKRKLMAACRQTVRTAQGGGRARSKVRREAAN